MKKTSWLKLATGIILGTYIGKAVSNFNKSDRKTKIRNLYKYWAKIYDFFISPWNFIIAGKAEKELNKFLKKNAKKASSILDIACGTGVNYQRINNLKIKYSSYLGLDMSEDMLYRAKMKAQKDKKAKFQIQDVLDYQNDKKYDLIICTWALSHMPDPTKFINKYLNKLNKRGYFALIYQSTPDNLNWFTSLVEKISNSMEANFVDDEEVDKFIHKAVLDKKYLDGYVRLIIFQK